MESRKLLGWFLVLALPPMIWSAYLFVSRTTRVFSETADQSALIAALAVGVSGIVLLVRLTPARVLAAVVYVVATGAGMVLGMEATVCAQGDCL